MGRRSAYLEHLAKVPMFSACSKRELQLVAGRGTDVAVDAGKQLVVEGRTGVEFFVIVDGKAKVTRSGKEVAVLGPGDFFGELALLTRAPRNATVTAATPLEAIVIDARAFDGFLEDAPHVAKKVMTGLAQRLQELDAKLYV